MGCRNALIGGVGEQYKSFSKFLQNGSGAWGGSTTGTP